VIDIADIRRRWRQAVSFLDERARRLFAANEALAQGHGGVTATSIATGLARSTIDRGIAELRSTRNDLGPRLRRPGGGRKSAVTHQPELPAAPEKLIEDGRVRVDGQPAAVARRATFDGASYLSSIGTASWARGRGFGDLVTNAATADAVAAGSEWTYLGVFADNEPALRLYRRAGFEVIGDPSPDLLLVG
jgi:GNAT superfamily N-acetyltransferase